MYYFVSLFQMTLKNTNREIIVIKNRFFDLIAFVLSFFLSFFRAFILFFKKKSQKSKNIFFDFCDFVLRRWSFYFWEKPSFYKFTSFIGDVVNFIFKK
jgi:hypothetical protein